MRSTLAILVVTACGCAGAREPARAAVHAPSPGDARAGWAYEVLAAPGGEDLAVEASFAAGTDAELSVEDGAEPFVRDVELADGGRWTPLAPEGTSWMAPSCARGCRVRYRFALRAAGRAAGAVTVARGTNGTAIEAPPSSWLLRPVRAPRGTPFRFHVASAPGESFVCGVFPVPGAADTYAGVSGDSFQLPYAAFGPLRVHDVGGGAVRLALLPGRLAREDDVVAWADRAARAVAGFYGKFPVPRLLVIARPVAGDGVGFGTTMGNAGAAIAIDVGAESNASALADDWVLVHEMIHTALPDLRGPHHWLEEGLATYVEPLARVRAGLTAPDDVWRDWIRGMPNGLPAAGDRGLDRTPTWGRTYWGGALFCLLADVEIRKRTHGARALDDALRAILAEGGNIASEWTMDRVIEVGDRATGVPVLRELYDRMSTSPAPVDLDALWKSLGVAGDGERVTYDDAAPLAPVRRAMTTG